MHLRARRLRLSLGVVLAALAIVLGALVVPVNSTLASFTDAETTAATPSITAGSLGTVTSLQCSLSGTGSNAKLTLTWTAPSQATIQRTGYRISFTDTWENTNFSIDVGTGLSKVFAANDDSVPDNSDYLVTVTAIATSAPSWLSATTDSINVTRSNGKGWKNCS
ncbi:hypothetical protein GCM10022381_18370 [Leifsonia kafniensis]|uniref:Fibronectin type-III domain-containing protein n=1 Tax=Leifsonia kafniensis TaxID=475957 RepID=A0ABP7KFR0_9MICO